MKAIVGARMEPENILARTKARFPVLGYEPPVGGSMSPVYTAISRHHKETEWKAGRITVETLRSQIKNIHKIGERMDEQAV